MSIDLYRTIAMWLAARRYLVQFPMAPLTERQGALMGELDAGAEIWRILKEESK